MGYKNEHYFTYVEAEVSNDIFEDYNLITIPNECPICGRTIRPITVFSYGNGIDLKIVFKCSHEKCDELFISYYQRVPSVGGPLDEFNLLCSKPKACKFKDFDECIKTLSPRFEKIYNQAKHAEELDLDEICGVGYRKALEFIIKDYCKGENPSAIVAIEKNELGKCITDYIEDEDIKNCSRRATWLGNDETHYVRKWNGKDIEDLKMLIDLTVFWISKKLTTKKYLAGMPAGRR